MSDFRPMETAPRDGTAIQARIPGNGDCNIIAWVGGLIDEDGNDCHTWAFVEDQEPPDCWTDGYWWLSNDRGAMSVKPDGWKPLTQEQTNE